MKTMLAILTAMGVLGAAPAQADGPTQASAELAVGTAYVGYQTRCTPREPPHLQSIAWESFHPAGSDPSGRIGGSGSIHDADPALGGQFAVVFDTGAPLPAGGLKVGPWDVVFMFC